MSLLDIFKRQDKADKDLLSNKNTPSPGQPAAPADEVEKLVENLEVRSMPEQFLGLKDVKIRETAGQGAGTKLAGKPDANQAKLQRPKGQGLKKNLLIGIILIIVLGGAMALAAFFFVRGIDRGDQSLDSSQPAVDQLANLSDTQPAELTPPATSDASSITPVTPAAPACPRCDFNTCPFGCELDIHGCWLGGVCLPAPDVVPSQEFTDDEVEAATPTTTEAEVLDTDEDDEVVPVELLATEDSDDDDLTELEELLYGTDPALSDTDGDGFGDGPEVLNLFDPNFGSGAQLKDSNRVRSFVSADFDYILLVPVAWREEVPLESGDQVRFVAQSGEFFTVIVEDNVGDFSSARDWYSASFPGIDESSLLDLVNDTLDGILSPDSLTAFFVSPQYIYTVSYNPGLREELNFLTTFMMMTRSFSLFSNPLPSS